jgi:hypothetical protein
LQGIRKYGAEMGFNRIIYMPNIDLLCPLFFFFWKGRLKAQELCPRII